MKVLVSAATKYAATGEIAQAVADVLAQRGCEVTVLPAEKVGAIEQFDAVVLGSAVYMGQWLKPARELAECSAAALATRPVWLFSSGLVGADEVGNYIMHLPDRDTAGKGRLALEPLPDTGNPPHPLSRAGPHLRCRRPRTTSSLRCRSADAADPP